MRTALIALVTIASFLLGSFGFTGENDGKNPGESVNVNEEKLPQQIRSIPMKEQYTFAGEQIPISRIDVMERLDRELTVNSYYHSSTVQHLKLSQRYFEIIEPILYAHGVPGDFKYLAVAESGLRNATSPAGAKGIWQFMKSTGQHYGLEINADVDERYHLEKSTEAAAKYLKHLKEKFGSWILAAAAYNAGETKISRLLEEQRADNYFELNMNQETMRYVFRIAAIKEIMSNPSDFGFQISPEDKYPSYPEVYHVEVNESIANWGDYAKTYGSDYRTLKYFNPWLRSSRLRNPAGKSYIIKIPKQ